MRLAGSEHEEQATFVDWLQLAHPDVLFHSIPNGAQFAGDLKRRVQQINKLKAEGLLPGTSDLLIAEPRGIYHGAYVEMKSERGTLSENQRWFLAEAEKRGYYTIIAHGFETAKEMAETYLSW